MFRPCIDLHEGKVKQIVGGSFLDNPDRPLVNFATDRPSRWYAELYRRDGLRGGHVIMLGPGNEAAALDALHAYPGGLQVGGGIRPENVQTYLDAGASHVIVTSYVFHDGHLDRTRLEQLLDVAGRERLVLDLSCRTRDGAYWVVTDRWTRFTTLQLDADTLHNLAQFCAEFLVHAVDVEGRCSGIDLVLVDLLGRECPIPVTYAGGAQSLDDLQRVEDVGQGRVDLTIGSALDIFGGTGIRYADAVAWNRRVRATAR